MRYPQCGFDRTAEDAGRSNERAGVRVVTV